MIPKIIHCCWFGNKAMPEIMKKNIEGWKKTNKDYEIKIWNENNFDYNSKKYTKQAYETKKWAFVTDYVRLKVLYDYGGIYMDTDVETIKSLDPLLKNKAFSGFEDNNLIPTATMGAEPGNKWIKALLDYYDDRDFILKSGEMDLTTNVQIITKITKSKYNIKLNNTMQNLGDVTFYPFDYLCAKSKVDGKVIVTENTYTIHQFNGSWCGKKQKIIKLFIKTFGYEFVRRIVNIIHFIKGEPKI